MRGPKGLLLTPASRRGFWGSPAESRGARPSGTGTSGHRGLPITTEEDIEPSGALWEHLS